MPVRVRLLLRPRDGGSELTCAALVNTGFTSDTPDLAVPPGLAERLGHWPPREALLVQLETGGGLAEGYLVPQAVAVRVATDDRCSREVVGVLEREGLLFRSVNPRLLQRLRCSARLL